jgi:hypothetical protein
MNFSYKNYMRTIPQFMSDKWVELKNQELRIHMGKWMMVELLSSRGQNIWYWCPNWEDERSLGI